MHLTGRWPRLARRWLAGLVLLIASAAGAIAAALLNKHQEDTGQVFKFKRLEVKTRPRVRVYADNFMVGRTPATGTAEISAVKVMLPR